MSRFESLWRQIEQYKKLAQALPPGTVQNDLEKLAHERQNEINAITVNPTIVSQKIKPTSRWFGCSRRGPIGRDAECKKEIHNDPVTDPNPFGQQLWSPRHSSYATQSNEVTGSRGCATWGSLDWSR